MTRMAVNPPRWTWLAGLIACLAVGLGLGASPSEIFISTQAAGAAQIEMPGLILSGILTGKIQQTGSIIGPNDRIEFEGMGDFTGIGYRDLLSLRSEAWAVYTVAGSTSAGQAMELRGLLYLHRVSDSLLHVGDILVGPQYILVTIGGSEQHFFGGFRGSFLQGGFVLPEPGMFLALAGEASFVLTGDGTARPQDAALSIPLPTAPSFRSFANDLRSLFPWLSWPVP